MKTEFVYGLHVLDSLLRSQPELVLEIWLQDSREDESVDKIKSRAGKQGIAVQLTDRKKLDQLTNHAVHQGAVARIQVKPLPGENELIELLDRTSEPAFLLFLDGIQDPQNLGACIRTAEAAGAQAVVFQKDRSASLTAVARKAGAGAAERLPVFQVGNLARSIETVKNAGVWVVGTAGGSDKNLYEIDLNGPLAIVMGAEGAGLRPRIQGLCDHLVAIPMEDQTESLNVSVATGVMLYEARRQRHLGQFSPG
ncbi:MAG: 23S rRNA (guanosine(2251)-2'-O)-methyltransferase RlmB [Acidiferrobacterales bacterium]